jgi:diguanylate cyclase (GGDEF)-like protein/PAS domain S-box-containing protein
MNSFLSTPNITHTTNPPHPPNAATTLTISELQAAIIRDPLIVQPSATVKEVIAQMSGMRITCDTTRDATKNTSLNIEKKLHSLYLEAKSSCVLVVQDQKLLGIFTERDVVRLAAQKSYFENLPIQEVMISPVITLTESAFTDLFSALNLLQRYRIRHVPVLGLQDYPVGLLTNETLRYTARHIDLLRLRLVSEVMNRQVICATPYTSMLVIAELMAIYRVSSVVIIRDDKEQKIPVGIITERDIVQFQALGLDLENYKVEAVMSTPVFSVKPDDSLWLVQKIMEQHWINRLPVVGEQGQVLGIVTQTTLLQALNPVELYKIAEILEERVIHLEAQVEKRTQELWNINNLQQAILNSAGYSVISVNLLGILQTFNTTAEKMLGYRAEEVIGKFTPELFHDRQEMIDRAATLSRELGQDIAPNFEVFIAQALQGLVSDTEWTYVRKDGSRFPVLLSVTVLKDAQQQLIGFMGIAKDISQQQAILREQQQSEAALRQSEKRFQTLVTNMPGMIYRYYPSDSGGYFTYVSSGSRELVELEPEVIIKEASAFWRLIHPKDYLTFQESILRAMASYGDWQWEGRLTTPSGRLKWIQGHSRPQDTPEGIVWDGLIIDISDRKQLEQEVIKNRDFREVLFNESGDALFLVDAETSLTLDCNQRAIEMFEANSKADLINIQGHILQKRPFSPEECIHIRKTIDQKGFWNLELEYITRRGQEFWGDLSLKPITFGGKQFNLVRVVDISDRKQTALELQQAKQQLETQLAELNQRNQEMVLLSEMSNFLQACLNSIEAYRAIPNFVTQLFPGCSGGLFIINSVTNQVQNVSQWGTELSSELDFHLNDCWALRRGRGHWIEPEHSGLRCKHITELSIASSLQSSITLSPKSSPKSTNPPIPLATLCIPMIAQGKTLGLFYLCTPNPTTLPNAKQQLARTVAEQLALTVSHLHLWETLQQKSIRDPLTGLFNRGYLEESLIREIAHAQRKHHSIGVIMLDIDNFKQFNDNFGHDAGDYILQSIGKLIQDHVRKSDLACRYGGEELTLILPESGLEQTSLKAEELRRVIRNFRVFYKNQYLENLTVSIGVAAFPQHGSTSTALLQVADAALYRAKAAGRNQVIVAP